VMAWGLWGHVSGVVGVWGLWVESLGCDGVGVVVIIFLSLMIVTTGSWGSWVESPGSMLNNGGRFLVVMAWGLSRDCQMMEKILESPRKSLINDESSRTTPGPS